MTLRLSSIDELPERHRAAAQRKMAGDAPSESTKNIPRNIPDSFPRPPLARGAFTAAGPKKPAKRKKPRRDEEHNEQVVFFNRIRCLALNDERYRVAADRTYAIPNGGGRSKREAGRLKAEGVRAGVADVFVSYPASSMRNSGGWDLHGLYIEMKSKTGPVSREQKAWIDQSLELGYAARVCRGADEAVEAWCKYVEERWGV